MFKQVSGEDLDEERGKVTKVEQDVETIPYPSYKRASNEIVGNFTDGERKRARISSVRKGAELTKSLEIDQCEAVGSPQDNSEARLTEVCGHGELPAGVTGNKTTGDESEEDKLMPAVASNIGVPGKVVRHSIVTKLTAEVAEDRGSRHTMEDAWVLLPQAWLGAAGKLRLAHYAIYDGHGGRHAAEYACAHLHTSVLSASLPRESVACIDNLQIDIKGAKRAIVEGFKNTDESLLRESSAGGWQDGATAVCVWVLGQMVFVANVGDAKAVLARVPSKGDVRPMNNSNVRADAMKEAPLKGVIVTKEHKAIFPQERARIQKAGGFVEGNGRLLGRLEVSRAFGDRNFKKAGVIAMPDIHVFELTERERFLILGCDGLWGVFGPSDAVEFVAGQLKDGVTVGMACRKLIWEAVRERKCKDNCTAIVVSFEHLQT